MHMDMYMKYSFVNEIFLVYLFMYVHADSIMMYCHVHSVTGNQLFSFSFTQRKNVFFR